MTVQPSPLARLFEAEEGALLRFAMGLVGRREVAEELVQEAFLRLQRVYTQVENPRAWLFRSLRNMALTHVRDHRRETGLEDPDAIVQESGLPADELDRKESVNLIQMLLAELPEEDRDLIRLKYHENLKYEEIARRTGLTAGNVGYRLHHLLKRLAGSLRQAGIEADPRRSSP